MNIGELIATLGVDTRQLDAATDAMRKWETGARANVDRVNQALRSSGESMKSFGRSASMYLTTPISLLGGASFKMYKDFDASMSKITGLVGVAREQVDLWRTDLLALAPVVSIGPGQLADALYFITSAGIKGSEAMEILEMSAKAATAGLGNVTVVADLATSAMNAYGVSNLSAERAVDILVATVREGKAAPEELAESMGQVLPIASAMGVTFDQVGATMAAMTRTGTNAATAATQLRAMLSGLIKPAKQAEQALEGMGTTSAQLRATIQEKGLLAALMDIKTLTTEFGEEMMAQVFPNIRALSGILDVMGSNIEDNIKIYKALENTTGTLTTAFQEATNTIEFKYNNAIIKAKTGLVSLGKTVSTAALPLITAFGNMVTNLTTWFNDLSESQKRLTVTIGGFLAVLGPVSIALGFLVGNVLPGLLTVGYGAVKMFHALKIAMLSNPVTAIAVGLAGLSVVLIELAKNMKKSDDAQRALTNVQRTAIQSTVDERAEIEKLLSIIKSQTATREQQEMAVKKLNAISPAYLSGITTETVLTGDATTAIEAYISALQRKAEVEAAMTGLEDLEKNRIENLANGYSEQIGWLKTIGNSFKDIWKKESFAELQRQSIAEQAAASQEQYTKKKEAYLKVITGQIGLEKDLGKQFEFVKGQMNTLSTASADQVKTIQQRIDAQLAAEKEYTGGLKKQLAERLANDEELGKLQATKEKALKSGMANVNWAFLANQIDHREKAVAQELEIEYKANQERIKELQSYKTQVEAIVKNIPALPGMETPTGSPGGNPAVDESAITEIMTALRTESENAVRMNELFGTSFDLPTKQAELFKQGLEALISAGLTPADARVQGVLNTFQQFQALAMEQGALKVMADDATRLTTEMAALSYELERGIDWTKNAATMSGVFEQVSIELAYASVQAERFTDAFNKTNAEVEIYANALQKLRAIPGPVTEEDQKQIDAYIEKLKALGYEFDKTSAQKVSVVDGYNQMAMALGQMGSAIDGTAGSWLQWSATVLGSIPKIIAAVVALTSASAAQAAVDAGGAVAGATKAGAKMPFPLNIAAITLGVAAVLGALASIPKAKKAAKMADGGRVPAGFPNDTYPAWLTSGETVVPPGKLPELGGAKTNVHVTVEGVVKGRDLHYIVKEVERKYQNSH